MKTIIGRKQSSDNETFVRAWQHIEELVSKDEAAALVSKTVEHIKAVTAGKNVGYAWSGGKDSLALQYVCKLAGIKRCVLGIARHLEYSAFLEWVEKNKPDGLRIWSNDNLTLEWLNNHPDMLFPRESSKAARWFSLIQHRAQAWFFKEYDLDMIILGRRLQDGNHCGEGFCYTDDKGVTRYSPIADWKHEEVMAVIHYFMNDNMPPIYDWKNGFKVGTGCFAARQYCGSVQQGWAEVWDIDPELVKKAAEKIDSANEFLIKQHYGK